MEFDVVQENQKITYISKERKIEDNLHANIQLNIARVPFNMSDNRRFNTNNNKPPIYSFISIKFWEIMISWIQSKCLHYFCFTAFLPVSWVIRSKFLPFKFMNRKYVVRFFYLRCKLNTICDIKNWNCTAH